MTTKYQPLISKSDLQAIHEGNQLNRQVLQDGIRALVKDTHKGNQQTGQLIKRVEDKWTNYQHEAVTLGKFIGDLLVIAHWLFIMALSSLILWLTSMVPILNSPVIGLLLELSIWACIFLAGTVLAGTVLAYYFVAGCERNNLDRFIKQTKKKAGK